MTSGTACNDHVVVDGVEVKPDQRHDLEHSIATAFVKWTKEREPGERTRLWMEMFRLARKLEELNDGAD